MKRYIEAVCRLLRSIAKDPLVFCKFLNCVPYGCSAVRFSPAYADVAREATVAVTAPTNPLWLYFQNHAEGRGIWKWEHYFDIYHRHFARFVGREVNVLEVGVYSGGSLAMWRSYFGEKSHIYGVDIEEGCKKYEEEQVSIVIGDQGDRAFWQDFKQRVEGVDVLIDDGGHHPEQQQVTLEEMLPSLKPGGVYLCEDIHNSFNRFASLASGLAVELTNGIMLPFQSSIYSIHFYPFVVVIEKNRLPVTKLEDSGVGQNGNQILESNITTSSL